jgi:hypothetical protein
MFFYTIFFNSLRNLMFKYSILCCFIPYFYSLRNLMLKNIFFQISQVSKSINKDPEN